MTLFRLLGMLLITQLIILNASCQAVDSTAISNGTFKELSAKENVVILDVRTTKEFNEGYIPGAKHIDVLQAEAFKKQIRTLPKDKTYLIYCRSGKRSATALNIMKENGFTNVKHLGNGIRGWDGAIEK